MPRGLSFCAAGRRTRETTDSDPKAFAAAVQCTTALLPGGHSFDTRYRIAADYHSILRLFSQPGFRSAYVPEVFVKMRMGGASNRSLRNIVRKSREDLEVLRRTGVGGVGALAWKNLGKLGQFWGVGPRSVAARSRRRAAAQSRYEMLGFATWKAFHARKRNIWLHGSEPAAGVALATGQQHRVRQSVR